LCATAAKAEPIVNQAMLVNANTNKCLTIAGGVSTDNNVPALQFDVTAIHLAAGRSG
jgi:cytolethal distending toxin subunit A